MSGGRDLRLSRDDIESLLRELGSELAARGVRGDLFVVGGAAMALAYSLRRITADVDAVFEPKAVVYEVAQGIAEHHQHLPADWLNDAVKGFLPGEDRESTVILDAAGIRVAVASPPYLLALKVLAARQDRDADDLRELAALCGVTSAQQVLEIAERYVGEARLAPKARFIVEELFAD
jgi:hypothetical protein